MRPPEGCDICGESGDEGPELLEFRPHEIAGGMTLGTTAGHPSHLVYLCEDHAERARRLPHLTFPEARPYLDADEPDSWGYERTVEEDVLRPLVESIVDPADPDRVGSLPRDELLRAVIDDRDVTTSSEGEVDAALNRLADRFAIDVTRRRDGTIVDLTADGLERFQDLSGQAVLLPHDLRDILVRCYQVNRRTPDDPRVSPDALHRETGFTESRINVAVWYLDQRDLVETTPGRGDSWWGSLVITDAGKQYVDTSFLHARRPRSGHDERG